MANYSIKDLEKVTGIKAHTIRIWEKRYDIVKPNRSDSNIRSYSDEDLKKLLNISLLNRSGMKISKLANLSTSELQKKVMDLAEKPEDSDTKIEALLLAMINLNEEDFQLALNTAIDKFGFEKAFLNVVRPFLIKAGILWVAGTINPAQEHFISNLIRQKLIVFIDRMEKRLVPNARRFLLFLPEGELHEMALLFFSYLIKKNGHDYLYLGQSTPLASAEESAQHWQPDFILLSLVNPMVIKEMTGFLKQLKGAFPKQEILISGYQVQNMNEEDLEGIQLIPDFQSFKKFLEEI